MTDIERPGELVQRLHRLRIERGMTIQQMAEGCGVPKSPLESYMKMSGAKRPGIDGLTAIADGMQVSLDWLVGRVEDSRPPKLTQKDYALACFNVVLGVLQWLRSEHDKRGASLFTPDSIAGIHDSEVAAKAMLVFVERLQVFENTSGTIGPDRQALFDDIRATLEGPELRRE